MSRLGKAHAQILRATQWVLKDETAVKFFGDMAEKYKQTALQNSLEVTGRAAEPGKQTWMISVLITCLN